MESLQEIYQRYKVDGDTGSGDKGGDVHSYIDVYEILFAPFRTKEINFVEIGISRGHSIMMWSEYFTKAQIVGLDINTKGFAFEVPENVSLIELDSTQKIYGTSNHFDIIIDDGDHTFEAQIKTFKNYSPFMRKGGIYIIEDVNGIDQYKKHFEKLHDNCTVIDLRPLKGRFDDVLIVYQF